jgi:transcriptional regulator with XRE-family HTH domain
MQAWLKNDASEMPAVLATLKTLFKSRNLLYQDVATILGKSETTVKRYLTGHCLTFDVLESLCRVVDMRLSDVLEIAREESVDSVLTPEEERQLAKQPFLAALFYLLAQGLTPATLQRDFDIGSAEMNGYLTALDRAGLIRLFPYNRVRLRVSRNFNVQRGGPLMRLAHEAILKGLFDAFEATSPDWSFAYAKLSASSLERVRDLVRNFVTAFEKIADGDRELPIDLAQWHGMLFMLQPVDIGGLRGWSARGETTQE